MRLCELQGIEATSEIQMAARKVAEENKKLRALLHKHGVDDKSIAVFLQSGTLAPAKSKSLSQFDAAGDTVRALEGVLGPRRPSCLLDSDPGSTPSGSSPAGSTSSIAAAPNGSPAMPYRAQERLSARGTRHASESSIDSRDVSEFYASQQPPVVISGPSLTRTSVSGPSKSAIALQSLGYTVGVSLSPDGDAAGQQYSYASHAQPPVHASASYGQLTSREPFPTPLAARASRMSPTMWHHLQVSQPLLRAGAGQRPASVSRVLSAIDENNGEGAVGASYYLDDFAFQSVSEYPTDVLGL